MGSFQTVILIIILVVITLFTGIMRPTVHKQVMIEDADFEFVEEQMPPKTQPVKTEKPESSHPASVNSQKAKPSEFQETQKSAKKTGKPEPAQKNPPAAGKQPPVTSPAAPEKLKEKPQKPPTAQAAKVLTEEEEIIIWNKWRSDLQNQIMKDTKIAAPLGTGFKFSFTVDKFGTISNLKVWSTSPAYSDAAVKVIKPVIQGYQGSVILKFPEGTKRVITNVTGGFRMAAQTGFSTPSDYSDVERVKN
jgi:hypothetical protein